MLYSEIQLYVYHKTKVTKPFAKGSFHLVSKHLVSYVISLRITCKKRGGGLDSMYTCVSTKWKAPKAHSFEAGHEVDDICKPCILI